jgi:hypothetical protein
MYESDVVESLRQCVLHVRSAAAALAGTEDYVGLLGQNLDHQPRNIRDAQKKARNTLGNLLVELQVVINSMQDGNFAVYRVEELIKQCSIDLEACIQDRPNRLKERLRKKQKPEEGER